MCLGGVGLTTADHPWIGEVVHSHVRRLDDEQELELLDLYFIEGWDAYELRDHYGFKSHNSIYNIIRKHGRKPRSASGTQILRYKKDPKSFGRNKVVPTDVDEIEMALLRQEERLGYGLIGEKTGHGFAIVRRTVVAIHGINVPAIYKPHKSTPRKRKFSVKKEKKVVKWYGKGLGMKRLAIKYGTSKGHIETVLKRYGVETRTMQESMAIFYEQGGMDASYTKRTM